ncbi:hypothetical protein [Neobacillus vireti]|uniref:hypothetical protein n=1 Tax=Neobacillus vireti TaxID=220686 RepID=UPI002FFED492
MSHFIGGWTRSGNNSRGGSKRDCAALTALVKSTFQHQTIAVIGSGFIHEILEWCQK